MKNKIVIIFLISIAFMFNACKKNTTEPNTGVVTGNFYPSGDGTTYKYNVQKTDSTGNSYSGTRSATYSGTTTLGGTVYQNEIDTISVLGLTSSSLTLFNKSDSGVNIAIDTTGLSVSIPSEYIAYISLDPQIKVLAFPFSDGANWNVFNVYLTLQSLKLNVVSVTASYLGMEKVTVPLTSGAVTEDAAKVQYQLKIITNPLAPTAASTFTADAWLVDNIGVVKWQGNGTILDAFAGGGINFADTTSTVTQTLISYKLK